MSVPRSTTTSGGTYHTGTNRIIMLGLSETTIPVHRAARASVTQKLQSRVTTEFPAGSSRVSPAQIVWLWALRACAAMSQFHFQSGHFD